MRANIGRILCFGLGFLFMAGAVPLFNFGAAGKQVWAVVEAQVTVIANAIGIWPWLAMWIVGAFAIGGPLALVWLIAGKQVNRTVWFLYGLAGYGVWWFSGYWPLGKS